MSGGLITDTHQRSTHGGLRKVGRRVGVAVLLTVIEVLELELDVEVLELELEVALAAALTAL